MTPKESDLSHPCKPQLPASLTSLYLDNNSFVGPLVTGFPTANSTSTLEDLSLAANQLTGEPRGAWA